MLMKKIIAVILALGIMLSFVACSEKNPIEDDTTGTHTEEEKTTETTVEIVDNPLTFEFDNTVISFEGAEFETGLNYIDLHFNVNKSYDSMTTIFEANPTFTVIQAGESLIIEETFGEYRIDGCAVDELYLPGITKRIIVAVELINNKDEIKVIISEPDEPESNEEITISLDELPAVTPAPKLQDITPSWKTLPGYGGSKIDFNGGENAQNGILEFVDHDIITKDGKKYMRVNFILSCYGNIDETKPPVDLLRIVVFQNGMTIEEINGKTIDSENAAAYDAFYNGTMKVGESLEFSVLYPLRSEADIALFAQMSEIVEAKSGEPYLGAVFSVN